MPPAEVSRPRPVRAAAATGSVVCLFDGSPAAEPRLLLASEAAAASGRRLVVAHVERFSTGFWAAAFTGYGACIGPAEKLFTTSAEAAFAAAVECLIDSPAGWDFVASRGGRFRILSRVAELHDGAVIVVPRRNRLFRRLARRRELTVLAAG